MFTDTDLALIHDALYHYLNRRDNDTFSDDQILDTLQTLSILEDKNVQG